MTCAKAMFTDFVSARPDQTVSHALKILDEHGIRAMPILDHDGTIIGQFHFRVLLSNLLPVSGEPDMPGRACGGLMDRDLKLTSIVGSQSEVKCADRLKTLLSVKLEDVMDTNFELVHPDTPLLECIRLLVKYRGPLGVTNKGDRKLIGLVTVQSTMRALRGIAVKS